MLQVVCDLIRWAGDTAGYLVVFLLGFPLTWVVLLLAAVLYAVKAASGTTS